MNVKDISYFLNLLLSFSKLYIFDQYFHLPVTVICPYIICLFFCSFYQFKRFIQIIASQLTLEDIFDRKFLFYLNISIFSRLRFLSLLVMVLLPPNCMCCSRCPFHLRCISYSYTEVLYTTSFCMMSEGEEQFHRLPERLPFNNWNIPITLKYNLAILQMSIYILRPNSWFIQQTTTENHNVSYILGMLSILNYYLLILLT